MRVALLVSSVVCLCTGHDIAAFLLGMLFFWSITE